MQRRITISCRENGVILRTGVIEIERNVIVQSARSCTSRVITKISAINWELVS